MTYRFAVKEFLGFFFGPSPNAIELKQWYICTHNRELSNTQPVSCLEKHYTLVGSDNCRGHDYFLEYESNGDVSCGTSNTCAFHCVR